MAIRQYTTEIYTPDGVERFSFDFNPEYQPGRSVDAFCPHTCDTCEWKWLGAECDGRTEKNRKISPCPAWEIGGDAYTYCRMELLKDLRRRNNG